ncbi:Pr6Pr family membrane protein [Serinibacter salmoneus]|uniref:FAR-17a/AIG1-like protein n=1 Tax=Serinibacter salmoneus TaxID=556530 RepID=A0A2A9D115_9MICO|nr:Pr6Pr family membrane protein [Serinibacter salmoneus]PFG20081.1 hypothetical protein ATL40_1664 [Serinibacter salmoneus]
MPGTGAGLGVALGWRSATLLLCVLGLLTDGWGTPFLSPQSNLLVAGYLACCLYWMVRRRTPDAPAPTLRGLVTVTIVFVGLISHWTYDDAVNPLPGLTDPDPAAAIANQSAFLIHYVVPAMMLLDWLFLRPHGACSLRRALLWPTYLIGYGVVITVRSIALPHVWARYPVPMFDPSAGGWAAVALAVLGLAAGAYALALLLWWLDRLIAVRLIHHAP